MVRKIVEVANYCGMTGIKRVAFYIVAPFIAGSACVVGFVKGVYKASRLYSKKEG